MSFSSPILPEWFSECYLSGVSLSFQHLDIKTRPRKSFMQKVRNRAQAMYSAVRAAPVVVIEAPSLSMSTITVAHPVAHPEGGDSGSGGEATQQRGGVVRPRLESRHK